MFWSTSRLATLDKVALDVVGLETVPLLFTLPPPPKKKINVGTVDASTFPDGSYIINEAWLDGDGAAAGTLTGFAGSPGVAEGTARVVITVDELDRLQDGEILVAPVTSPSWTPAQPRCSTWHG